MIEHDIRHAALLEHHWDVAQLMCSEEMPCLWVLDIEDPVAVALIEAMNETLGSNRKVPAVSEDTINAEVFLLGLDCSNKFFSINWRYIKPLPPGKFSMVIVSDGSINISTIPPRGGERCERGAILRSFPPRGGNVNSKLRSPTRFTPMDTRSNKLESFIVVPLYARKCAEKRAFQSSD